MDEWTYKLAKCAIQCGTIVIVAIIIAVSCYQIADLKWPGPKYSQIYYWPASMGPSIGGSNNSATIK